MKITLQQLMQFSEDTQTIRKLVQQNQENWPATDWRKLHFAIRRMETLAKKFEETTVTIKWKHSRRNSRKLP